MLLRSYLVASVLVTGFYLSAAYFRLKGPDFGSSRSGSSHSSGGVGFFGGRSSGGSGSSWHGGK